MNTEPRFNYQNIDHEDNKPDLQKWVDEDPIEVTIDENSLEQVKQLIL